MRILVVSSYFYPHIGGSEQYIENLYSTLSKKYQDVQVDILCYNTNQAPSFEKYKNFNIYRVSAIEILPDQFALPNYFSLFFLIRKLKKNNYDLINSHTRFFDNSWWTPVMAKYLGARSLLTDHCASYPTHRFFVINLLTRVLDYLIIPFLNMLYDYKIAVSLSTKNFLKKHGMKEISVFYGGIDLDDFGKKVKKPENKVVVSFIGRMIPSKGPQILLKAAQNLIKNNNELKLEFNFAGDGELYQKLKEDSSKNIKFLGRLNKKQVPDLLAKTHIFVLPTTHHEGFPISLLEAGQAKCSVITTAQGGIVELIKDGENGLLIKATAKDVEEKISLLARDKKLRERLSNNLYQTITKRFSWEKISSEFYSFLSSKI